MANAGVAPEGAPKAGKPSSVIDTRVIYCGDNLERRKKLPDGCVDPIYIDPLFNSNRNYEVFWGETKERRSFEDRHESTHAYIEFMRPRCVEMGRVLKNSGSFTITAIGTPATTSKLNRSWLPEKKAGGRKPRRARE